MWSPNDKVWSPKWENEESNFWPTYSFTFKMKKALGETQTLRAGRSKRAAKNVRPIADPVPGGTGPPKFNQLKMVTTFTYEPSLVKIDARNFELLW